MSVENKGFEYKSPDIKDLKNLASTKGLDTQRFNAFLDNLENKTENTVEFKKDCNRSGLEIMACQQGEKGAENTEGFCSNFNNAFSYLYENNSSYAQFITSKYGKDYFSNIA